MSDYQGNIIIKNPATPTGPAATGRAPGMWKLNEVAYWIKQGVWPNPSIVPDTYFPYVSLLLSSTSLSNANNNLFVDSSGAFNPVSRFGNTAEGSFTPYGSNWSNYFDGSGDYLGIASNAAFGMGTGDFTLECWVNPSAYTGTGNVLIDMRSGTEPSVRPDLEYNSSGVLNYRVNGSTVISGGTLVIGTWSHVALARSGTTTKLFLNGTQVGSSYTDTNNYGSSAACRIGADDDGSPNAYVNGYMSNVRVVKGTAVYTANFTPPTAPLTAISGTSLLTCQSNRFIDNSSNAFTITVNGDTKVQKFSPFSSSTYTGISYNQSDITNWSGYFDGSGDWLDAPSSSSLGLSTGSFTVEGWIYPTSTASNALFWGSTTSGALFIRLGQYGGTAYSGIQIGRIGVANDTFSAFSFTAGQWYHIAVVRNGSTMTIYVNGTSINSFSNTTDYGSSATARIGATESGGENYAGYISNLRVVKGTAVYTSAFTPPTTNLTAISGTSLLTLQNAAFTDNSTNNFVITPNGNTTVTGNSPFNTVGYWSNYFNGGTDRLQVPVTSNMYLGTTYTIEAWVYYKSNSYGARPIFNEMEPFQGGFAGLSLTMNTSGQFVFEYRPATSGAVTTITGPTVTPNTWYHIAVSNNATSAKMFVNGVQVGSTTTIGDYPSAKTNTVAVGSWGSGWNDGGIPAAAWIGYISNLRVVKGTAVYTANFTPPTTPLTAISGTVLLTCQNGRFIDNSSVNNTLTPVTTVAAQPFNPFYTSTIASNGGSMYFDGSGDYLSIPALPIFNIGSADACLELWIYPQSTADIVYGGQNGGPYSTIRILQYSGNFAFTINDDTVRSSSIPIVLNQWAHLAVTITGGVARMFVNGVLRFYGTGFGSVNTNSYPYYVGAEEGIANYTNGYMTDYRLSIGAIPTSYQTSSTSTGTTVFTPPTAPLTPTPSTVLLVNGMNAGIYDATAINDMESVGNAQVRYFLGNYYAGSFDGSGDYLSTATSSAIALGTSDFTFECWVNPTAYPNDATLVYAGNTSTGNEITLQIRNGQVASHLYISGSHSDVQFTDLPVSLNTWSHLAISRVSGVLYGFLNGVRSSVTTALTANFGSSAAAYVAIGDRFAGSLSNARMTKNVAIYSTATYTVPTSPLSATSNTAFLTCQNTTFADNSPNALAITVNGGATAGVSGPFTYTRGNSMYFDGSGDYLSIPASPNLTFGTGDFTMELWVYSGANGTSTRTMGNGAGAGWSANKWVLGTGDATYVNKFIFGCNNANSGAALLYSTTAFNNNTWNYVAITRSGSTWRLFVNGVLESTATSLASLDGGIPATITVGRSGISGDADWAGYVDDVRLTKGIARYTSNFTPPTQPFPVY